MSVTPLMAGACQCGAVRRAFHRQPEGDHADEWATVRNNQDRLR